MGDEAASSNAASMQVRQESHFWQRVDSHQPALSLWPSTIDRTPQKQQTSSFTTRESTLQQHGHSTDAQISSAVQDSPVIPLRAGHTPRTASDPTGRLATTHAADFKFPTVPPHATNAVIDESAGQGSHSMSRSLDTVIPPVSPLSHTSFDTAAQSPTWINRQAASSVQALHALGLPHDSPMEAGPGTPISTKTAGSRWISSLRGHVGGKSDECPPPPPPKSPRHYASTRKAPPPEQVAPQPAQPSAATDSGEKSHNAQLIPEFRFTRGFNLEVPALAQSVTRGVVKPVFIENSSSRPSPVPEADPPDMPDIAQTDSVTHMHVRKESIIKRPIVTVVTMHGRSSPSSVDLSKPSFPVPPSPTIHSRLERDESLKSLFLQPEVKQTPVASVSRRDVGDHAKSGAVMNTTQSAGSSNSKTRQSPAQAHSVLPSAVSRLNTNLGSSVAAPNRSSPPRPAIPNTTASGDATTNQGSKGSASLPKSNSVRPAASFALFPRAGDEQSDLPLRRKPVNPNPQSRPSTPQDLAKSHGISALRDQPQPQQIATSPSMNQLARSNTPVQLSPAPSREAIREMRAQGQAAAKPESRFLRQYFRAPSPQPPSRPAPVPENVARRRSPDSPRTKALAAASGQEKDQSDPPRRSLDLQASEPGQRGRPGASSGRDQPQNQDPPKSITEKQTRASSIASEARSRSSASSGMTRMSVSKTTMSSGLLNAASHVAPDESMAEMVARIQKLAQDSEALHTRYALLRSDRLKLSSSLTASLKEGKSGPENASTLLDQHLSLCTIGSSMDICFAKLKTLDCRKEEAISALVAYIAAQQKNDQINAAAAQAAVAAVPELPLAVPQESLPKVESQSLLKDQLESLGAAHSSLHTTPESAKLTPTVDVPKMEKKMSLKKKPELLEITRSPVDSTPELTPATPEVNMMENVTPEPPRNQPELQQATDKGSLSQAQPKRMEPAAEKVADDSGDASNDQVVPKISASNYQEPTTLTLINDNANSRNSTIRLTGEGAARIMSMIAQEATRNSLLAKPDAESEETVETAQPASTSKTFLGLRPMMLEVDIPTSPFKLLAPSLWDSSPGLELSEHGSLSKSHSSTGGSSDTTLKRAPSVTTSSTHESDSLTSSEVDFTTDSSTSSRDEPEIGTPGEEKPALLSARSSTKVSVKSPGMMDDDLLDYYVQMRNGSISSLS